MEQASVGKTALEALATTLVGTLITAALGVALAYFTSARGSVAVGAAMEVADADARARWLVPIEVSNFTSSDSLTLHLELPRNAVTGPVVSSRPARASFDTSGSSPIAVVLRLEGLASRSVTRFLLPVDSGFSASSIIVRNAEAAGIGVSPDTGIESRFVRAAREVGLQALVYSACFFVAFFVLLRWLSNQLASIGSDTEKLKKEVERTSAQADKSRARLDAAMQNADNRVTRIRILLLARISDLQQELAFWRDTLRGHLIAGGRDPAEADDLFRTVSARLGTWSTHSVNLDTKTIDVVKSMLAPPSPVQPHDDIDG